MKPDQKRRRKTVGILPGLLGSLLLFTAGAGIEPPRITVLPRGTDEIEIVAGPIACNTRYDILVRTNSPEGYWLPLDMIYGSTNPTVRLSLNLSTVRKEECLKGLALHNLRNWTFVIGTGEDSDGDGLTDIYEDLASRTDPYNTDDGYNDLDSDNWCNIQEQQNQTNPYEPNPPPGPQAGSVSMRLDKTATLSWSQLGSIPPDYFLIERAQRSFRPKTNHHTQTSRSVDRRNLSSRSESMFPLGPFEVIARVPPKPGAIDYQFIDTNVDTFLHPEYRIRAHFTPPIRAYLTQTDTTTIRQTLRPFQTRVIGNGFEVTGMPAVPHGLYLLLVRDRNNPQWRASGYFRSGPKGSPTRLLVNAKGMLENSQQPRVLPNVRFLPIVTAPQFMAGWGEDQDGDGIPDIAELLVTQTDPVNADTDGAGILDGYKDPDQDGWNNLMEFRRRSDPRKISNPPPMVELQRPTLTEVRTALAVRADLGCEPEITIRKAGTTKFVALHQSLTSLYSSIGPQDPAHIRMDFDVRIYRGPRKHGDASTP